MKKLFLILLSALSLSSLAQEKKTVAVLDPICRDKSVNAFFQQMVRGAMESAVTASSEYEAYDRSAFDQIQKEQAFQRTGAVSDSQIKKMGEMAGVDYVLVSEVSAYEGYLSAVIKILNVTTGKYDKSVDDFMELKPNAVKSKCNEMAASLFGSSFAKTSTSKKEVPAGYVDLGLPSGTLWKEYNENCGLITYDQARHYYGNSLPTKQQWEELISNCFWTWIGNGYRINGSNGKSITLPAAGFSDENGFSDLEMVGQVGYYWSLTLSDDNIGYSWGLPFGSDFVGLPGLGEIPHKYGQSIRLIKLSKEK